MMSEFAQRQMKMSGWKKGKGLGKNEDGMAEALKVKIKADNAGVGHDPGEQFTFHWWEHVFAKSANNISVRESEEGVLVSTNSETSVPATKKNCKVAPKEMLYGCFVKSGVLEDGKVMKESSSSSDSDSDSDNDKKESKTLTDEQLFAACGGRTAHKGARHGVTLSGKLARLEEHEQSIGRDSMKKSKKGKKKKQKSQENGVEKVKKKSENLEKETDEKPKKKKKCIEENEQVANGIKLRKKKKRKNHDIGSVSEVMPQKKVKRKKQNVEDE